MSQNSTLHTPIHDREAAGQVLVPFLRRYQHDPIALVLALPRGGVPVAYEIAVALELPLDVLMVHNLGVPFHEELAMGAISSGGVRVLNTDVVRMSHIDEHTLDVVTQRELQELQRREKLYRGTRPSPSLRERLVILVDDGLATGAKMRAAMRVVRNQGAARIVIAVPVAPKDMISELREEVDELICPFVPVFFTAIGSWYTEFSQLTDHQVITLLERAWQRSAGEQSNASATTEY